MKIKCGRRLFLARNSKCSALNILCYLVVLFCINTQISAADNKDTLKLIQILFRHGDRTPTDTYKNDPHKHWPEGWGQLTKVGKQRMYHLGLTIRNNYSDFLSEYYSPDKVQILSSYADRNLMSAQLVMAGLYPPVKDQIWNTELLWQPIPIKYDPRSLDNKIALKAKCPTYDAALKSVYQSVKLLQIDRDNAELYKYLTEHAGQHINSIGRVETLYNTFEIESQHNLSLPEWTKHVPMSRLRSMAAQSLALFSETEFMKRLKGGPLLKEIIARMLKKSQNTLKPDLDVVLYSGHDLTIVTLLRTLGFEELLKPEYAAMLIFELHEVNGKYDVKLLYKPDSQRSAKNLILDFCSEACSLDDFVRGLQPVTPVDWEKECLNAEV